jgi:alanyl-tRNA synthetase
MQEAAEQRRELHQLQEVALAAEAQRLLEGATLWQGVRVVQRAFSDRDPQEVRRLATVLSETGSTVALLGSGGRQARLVFARSEGVPADMAALLRQTCAALGGSGGGQPHLAQGGGLPGEKLNEALQSAYRTLTSQ